MDSLNVAMDYHKLKLHTVSVSIGCIRISLLLYGGSDPAI